MTGNRAHGWSVWTAMMVLFVTGVVACWWAESHGNPIHQAMGVVTGDVQKVHLDFGY